MNTKKEIGYIKAQIKILDQEIYDMTIMDWICPDIDLIAKQDQILLLKKRLAYLELTSCQQDKPLLTKLGKNINKEH